VIDKRLGSGARFGFEHPLASMFALSTVAMIAMVAVYDRALVPCLRRCRRAGTAGAEGGLSILKRVDVSMAFLTMALGIAVAVERQHLLLLQSVSAPTQALVLVSPCRCCDWCRSS
jgi:hypothetical protein